MTEPTNSNSTSEGVKHPCPRCGATDYHQFNGAIGCLLCGLMHGTDPSDGFSLDAAKAEHDNWFCWKEIENLTKQLEDFEKRAVRDDREIRERDAEIAALVKSCWQRDEFTKPLVEALEKIKNVTQFDHPTSQIISSEEYEGAWLDCVEIADKALAQAKQMLTKFAEGEK